MENTTPRKAWETPRVFVLGAEGTKAFSIKGTFESTTQKTYNVKGSDCTIIKGKQYCTTHPLIVNGYHGADGPLS